MRIYIKKNIEDQQIDSADAIYLNDLFGDVRDSFSFFDKKVAFLVGNTAFKTNKTYYFASIKGYKGHGHSALIILNAEQKKLTDDYDAVIVYWSKRRIPLKDIIERISSRKNDDN